MQSNFSMNGLQNSNEFLPKQENSLGPIEDQLLSSQNMNSLNQLCNNASLELIGSKDSNKHLEPVESKENHKNLDNQENRKRELQDISNSRIHEIAKRKSIAKHIELISSDWKPRSWYTFALVAFSLCLFLYAYISYIWIHIIPYYTYYNPNNLFLTFKKSLIGFLTLILIHIIFQLGMVSYLRTIFEDPGGVPHDWKLSDRNIINSKKMLSKQNIKLTTERMLGGSIRICRVCVQQKPDRTHHCSSCQRCVLRMDHHCPWVNNCVGFNNHKFFILFIFWLVVGSFFVDISLLMDIVLIFLKKSASADSMIGFNQLNTLWVFFIAFFFGFSLSFFLLFHIKMILWNETTLQTISPSYRNENPFDLGFKKNFLSFFGNDWKYWLVPTRYSIPGDGISFEINEDFEPA